MKSEKVPFADALRGIAALSVLVSHYMGAFWTRPDAVPLMTGMPFHGLPLPTYLEFLQSSQFNWGEFGVAVFFIISGFVIPFSFNTYGRFDFLLARAFRLYPTYWAGLTVGIVALYLGGLITGTPFPHTLGHVLINYSLGLRDVLWTPAIDPIVWTLEIELKFYLVCAFIAPLLQRGSLLAFTAPPIMFAATMILALILPSMTTPWLNFIALSAPFVSFMFVGVAFNYLYRGKIEWRLATVIISGLCLLLLLSMTYGYMTWPVMKSYVLAVVVFALAMKLPAIVTQIPTVQFWAKISYPLYVSHALTGYVVLSVLLHYGSKAWAAIIATFFLSTALAYLIHIFVEQPTHKRGRKFAVKIRDKLLEFKNDQHLQGYKIMAFVPGSEGREMEINCPCGRAAPMHLGFIGRILHSLVSVTGDRCNACNGSGKILIDPISHFALPD